MAGRYAVVAYEQRRGGTGRTMIAASRDGGRHWLIGREALPKAPGTQQTPAITIDRRGRMTLAYAKKNRIYFAQGRIGARRGVEFAGEHELDPRTRGTPQWLPSLALGPGGVVHAAWVDAGEKFADGRSQASIRYTRITGGQPERSRRLDEGAPAKLATRMDNAWVPSVAVSGKRVLVTWIDFQNYDWDVMSRLSNNGGSTFAKQVDSNPEKPEIENLSDSPRPVFTTRGPFIAWTDFHKRDTVDRVHPLYDTYIAPLGRTPVQADPYGGRQVSTFWPSVCADGRDVIVAFQDSATAVAGIKVTRMRDGTARGRAFALSDGPSGSYRPSIACSGGRFVAAWEDMRSGPPRIYAARGSLRRIR
jgi:hypothetical protein